MTTDVSNGSKRNAMTSRHRGVGTYSRDGNQRTQPIGSTMTRNVEAVVNHPARTDSHNSTEHERREAALDETIEQSFPASDPPSSDPNPDDHDAITPETSEDDT
jgi:hypothetical protein